MDDLLNRIRNQRKVFKPGTLVKIISKPEMPENTKPYGIEILDYVAYKKIRETGLRVWTFPRNTVGLVLELSSWNEALVLIYEKIYLVSLFFIKPLVDASCETISFGYFSSSLDS